MRKTTLITLLLALAAFIGHASAQSQLAPLVTFGPNGDGSIRPGDRTYVGIGSLERGMAFNPQTGHLLLVHRDTAAPSFTVHILDGSTGADLGQMTVEDVTAGNTDFKLNLIGVADDGAIYACNLSSATTPPQLVLYRAADESQTLAYVNDYDPSSGGYLTNSANRRWGDTMAVRGAGATTQILLGTQSGNLAAVLTPDGAGGFNCTTLTTDVQNGAIGYGVTFGAGNTFWAKGASTAGNPLLRLGFALGAGTATTLQTYATTNFPGRVGPLMLNVGSNLLAAIEALPNVVDRVRLYDVSNLANPPVLLDWWNYPTNAAENNVYAGAAAFGTNSSGAPTLYALDCNSGIMAFSLVASNHTLSPTIFQQPLTQLVSPGSDVTFMVGADGIPAPTYYQWYFNATNVIADATASTLLLTNVSAATNNGTYSVAVSNSVGALTSSVARLTVVAASAGLIAYEPFDYTAGQLLTAASPLWVINGTGNDVNIASGNLNVPGLPAPVGNSITNGGGGAGVRYNLPSAIIDGDLYYSFAMRIDSVGTLFTSTSSFIAAFDDGGSTTVYGARLMPRTNTIPGQFNLGLGKTASGAASAIWATNDFVEGETIFIVARYTFNPTTTSDDQADLWINPSPADFGGSSPPAPTLTAPLLNTDITVITQFGFRQNSTGNTPAAQTFDEVRVGRTWASVTPVYVPPPPVLSVALSGINALISWPTNNSDGYVLEGIKGFDDADGWLPASEPQVVQGANNTVTVTATNGIKIFRLKK